MAGLPYEKALERISRICSRREKNIYDVLRKLESWEMKEEDVQRMLRFLKEKNFVDDERYARAYAYNQHHFRKWGKIKIRMMLKQKKISDRLIEKALDQFDEDEYLHTLKGELMKKRKSLKGKNRYDLMMHLQRFAFSRGYEQDIIRKVIDDVLEE